VVQNRVVHVPPALHTRRSMTVNGGKTCGVITLPILTKWQVRELGVFLPNSWKVRVTPSERPVHSTFLTPLTLTFPESGSRRGVRENSQVSGLESGGAVPLMGEILPIRVIRASRRRSPEPAERCNRHCRSRSIRARSGTAGLVEVGTANTSREQPCETAL
jgi:hypothetical protein